MVFTSLCLGCSSRLGGRLKGGFGQTNPVLMRVDGLFRKQFDDTLEANNPEAHYLERLRYDLVMAKKHIFKAVNKVDEALFVMAMLSICGGEKELGEFFTEQLFALPSAKNHSPLNTLRVVDCKMMRLFRNSLQIDCMMVMVMAIEYQILMMRSSMVMEWGSSRTSKGCERPLNFRA
ncbi:F15O4.14 [Arabidopsis thaliana]|uniref:F15O4.14 n=1 Tax=Arabidopsis thaliana TaxID=3702 RepID=Q9LQH1_ARATH|nr:F15O4.14 [Arabidopsis thaliana]